MHRSLRPGYCISVGRGRLGAMPVIVVGADTHLGSTIVRALLGGSAEVRAFVTDSDAVEPLRAEGAKVAVGDVSDGSHVGSAAYKTFCAILLAEASVDERERSFASTAQQVLDAWASGLRDAKTTRAIWVGEAPVDLAPLRSAISQVAAVGVLGRSIDEVTADVISLEETADVVGP